MKKIVLFFVIAIVFAIATTGCVGPRTGSVGYRHTRPILTTNLVGTVTVQQVGEQPPVTYAQTNFSIVSTPPIQERTWREKWTGQRSPADQSVIPPFPNAGVYGTTPNAVTVSQGRTVAPQRTGGPRYGIGPNGAKYLLPGRRTTSTWRGSGTVVRVRAYTHGRVNTPMTGFERSARGHAASIGTLPQRRYIPYGTVVKTRHITVVAAGRGTAISGLALPRRR